MITKEHIAPMYRFVVEIIENLQDEAESNDEEMDIKTKNDLVERRDVIFKRLAEIESMEIGQNEDIVTVRIYAL